MQPLDPKVPKSLLRIQTWIGKVLQIPSFELDSHRLPILDEKVRKEANDYILPSKTLRCDQRIAIYNQQYWLRLLKILKKDFPLLARLFGKVGFEKKIATPYLQTYPPSHWSLYQLGKDLPYWIEKNYPQGGDKKLVHHAAILDRAFSTVFFEKEFPPIQEVSLEKTVYLQPYLRLLVFDADLCSFREEMIEQEVDYWLSHDFPYLQTKTGYYFILFRYNRRVEYLGIEKYEFDLLKRFQDGTSIVNALDTIVEDFPNLDHWFKRCVRLKWLTYRGV